MIDFVLSGNKMIEIRVNSVSSIKSGPCADCSSAWGITFLDICMAHPSPFSNLPSNFTFSKMSTLATLLEIPQSPYLAGYFPKELSTV